LPDIQYNYLILNVSSEKDLGF